MPRCYPPIGRPIGTPPCDTHITWPWRLRPAVSYQSSGAASAPGGNTPRALYGAGADGHPEAPDRRPLGACPYRRQCAECSPSKFIGGPLQTVMGRLPQPSSTFNSALHLKRSPQFNVLALIAQRNRSFNRNPSDRFSIILWVTSWLRAQGKMDDWSRLRTSHLVQLRRIVSYIPR